MKKRLFSGEKTSKRIEMMFMMIRNALEHRLIQKQFMSKLLKIFSHLKQTHGNVLLVRYDGSRNFLTALNKVLRHPFF